MEAQRRHKSTTHKEMYCHVQEEHGKWRGGTVFARREGDGRWYANVALCIKEDQFCKRIGRTIARRRYMTKELSIGSPLHRTGYLMTIAGETPNFEELKYIYTQSCLDHTQ